MQPHKIVLGVLLFSLFVFGGIYILYGTLEGDDDGLFEVYDIPKDFFADKLQNLTEPEKISQEIHNLTSEQLEEGVGELETEGQFSLLDIGPAKSIRRMFSYFGVINTLVEEIALLLHLPIFIVKTIAIAVQAMIVFLILYFFMKFQPRDD